MVETLDPWYVTGLVDGEGCFGLYSYARPSRGVNKSYVTATFSMQLREDDIGILEKMQSFFGCGNVCRQSRAKARREGMLNARDMATFKVGAIADLVERVIPHFDKHLPQAKKLTDYLIWREAVMILEARALHFREKRIQGEDRLVMLDKVLGFAADLRAGRNPALRRSSHDLVAVGEGS